MSREIVDREHVGRLMHESWSRTKRALGFHWIGEPCPIAGSLNKPVKHRKESHETSCIKFHSDLIPWDELHENQKDINRHAFDDVLPYFERLLADERKPMKCGHPKACLVPDHFFIAMKPCDKPYDIYVCEICGQNMHKHTDGGGTAWIMNEYCSACAEREKVKERYVNAICVLCRSGEKPYLRWFGGKNWDGRCQAWVHNVKLGGCTETQACQASAIRQLDLTAPSSREEKNG